MKRKIFLSVLCALWIFMLIKTVLAMQLHDISPTYHYYGVMLNNTWQAHFNVDLLVHSILFACWILYRERSRLTGVLCGMAAVYFGALFSLLYLIVAVARANADTDVLFKGEVAGVS